MKNLNKSLERKFLHDLASPLSIARLTIQRVLSLLETSQGAVELKMTESLKKALLALEDMEALHANHKAKISKLDSDAA